MIVFVLLHNQTGEAWHTNTTKHAKFGKNAKKGSSVKRTESPKSHRPCDITPVMFAGFCARRSSAWSHHKRVAGVMQKLTCSAMHSLSQMKSTKRCLPLGAAPDRYSTYTLVSNKKLKNIVLAWKTYSFVPREHYCTFRVHLGNLIHEEKCFTSTVTLFLRVLAVKLWFSYESY